MMTSVFQKDPRLRYYEGHMVNHLHGLVKKELFPSTIRVLKISATRDSSLERYSFV